MSALEIQQLPRQEKLKLMEMLWADLSRDEAELESPAWHADALRETAERRARGEETVLDWEQAKAKLRAHLAPCQNYPCARDFSHANNLGSDCRRNSRDAG
jgi:Putative addiction module component